MIKTRSMPAMFEGSCVQFGFSQVEVLVEINLNKNSDVLLLGFQAMGTYFKFNFCTRMNYKTQTYPAGLENSTPPLVFTSASGCRAR